jgi:hypothetical protein
LSVGCDIAEGLYLSEYRSSSGEKEKGNKQTKKLESEI